MEKELKEKLLFSVICSTLKWWLWCVCGGGGVRVRACVRACVNLDIEYNSIL